ncbi:hypothetical protein KAR52_03360 [Candidatus Pacearchaeota archaeon]|nr:hypothetical protein [Candidatus Pacearchaeota archaeon]
MTKEKLSPIERKYAKTLDFLKKQKKGSNVDNIIINFLTKQIKEIKEGKRNELDIGDTFQIGLFAKDYGLKLSEKMFDLLIELSDYKVEINGKVLVGELGIESIEDVEKELNKIKEKLSN